MIGKKLQHQVIAGFAPTKKAVLAKPSDDDEYGNFEPDVKPHNKSKAKGRNGRGGHLSKSKT